MCGGWNEIYKACFSQRETLNRATVIDVLTNKDDITDSICEITGSVDYGIR